jgi:6-oxo-cyclohex-1-ene-carbonyl-CoA hydrolase
MTDFEFKNHDISPDHKFDDQVRYELKPAKNPDGTVAEGLYAAWIILDNPKQFNSYTTQMVKDVIHGFRMASHARNVVATVFTASGDRAFCTGGNTKEYAEYYAGRPEEYQQYMRLFNDMVTTILMCDKPVICRVNGMRIAGGQEIGMATDFTVASDLANFGQAGPKHGSAPVGGSTDFLPLYVGVERAMYSGVLCEPWTAYQALDIGLISEVVPTLKVDGKFIPNPMVVTDKYVESGRKVYGQMKTGEDFKKGKEIFKSGTVDLTPLDEAVDRWVTALMMTFPGCTTHTIMNIRRQKLAQWENTKEMNRNWLGLNMMNEANAGFRAFNEGTKEIGREADFVSLRQQLAQGVKWGPELIESVLPANRKK